MVSQRLQLVRWWLPLLLSLVATLITTVAAAQPDKPTAAAAKTTRVGIVYDGPSEFLQRAQRVIEAEVKELTRGEFNVSFPADKRLTGDWKRQTAKSHLDTLMSDADVDMVFVFGLASADAAARHSGLKKPTIAPFMLNERFHGLIKADGSTTPRTNLSYVVWKLDFERDLKLLQELGPFQKIAFLSSTGEPLPGVRQTLIAQFKKAGATPVFVPTKEDADATVRAIPADVQAVYVGPLMRMPKTYAAALAKALVAKRLPSFAWRGREDVQRGLLLGLAAPSDLSRLARRVALNVQSLLLKEPTSSQSKAFQTTERLVINMATARQIGVYPNWTLITEAELLNHKRGKVTRKLSLKRAVREATKSNLDLAIARIKLRASKSDVRAARAGLFPQLEVGARGVWIDKDRAGASAAERTLSWSATLNQSLYNEKLYANLKVRKLAVKSVAHERDAVRLDVVRDVAVAYLNLLKAQNAERIQRNNLNLSRSNLALARKRKLIGSGSAAEVFRWESQIANDRRALISSASQRNLAEMEVNRLLNRPLEEPFLTRESSMAATAMLQSEKRIAHYVNNPFRFRVLRDFFEKEATRIAPELKATRLAIAAKQRELKSNRSSYFLPNFSLQASLTHRFLKDGEGSEQASVPPQFQGVFSSPDNLDWQVAAVAQLPLFEGGARYARTRKAEAELLQLTLETKNRTQLIRQRIRVALHRAGASYPGVRLTQDAAKAAQGNLKLITEAYSAGTTTILTLLDAQNQTLAADLAASNAVYDFLADVVEVRRAIGVLSPDAKGGNAFFQRLDTYLASRQQQDNARGTR